MTMSLGWPFSGSGPDFLSTDKRGYRRVVLAGVPALTMLSLLFVSLELHGLFSTNISNMGQLAPRPAPFLVVAIGSKPENFALRQVLRDTWVGQMPRQEVEYRFFTEIPPDHSVTAEKLTEEQRRHGDLVFLDHQSGYTGFALRGLSQIRWALGQYPGLKYYHRLDDDTYLCWDKFWWELKQRPRQRFFWGKYWCNGRHRADENFMLFSADIIKYIDSSYSAGLIDCDTKTTFAMNYAKWALTLNITSFDDRDRIDSQQTYTTKYMHEKSVPATDEQASQFCESYIYAHHVRCLETIRKVYKATVEASKRQKSLMLPELTLHTESCRVEKQDYYLGNAFFFSRQSPSAMCARYAHSEEIKVEQAHNQNKTSLTR